MNTTESEENSRANQEVDLASPILFLFLTLILGSVVNQALKNLKIRTKIRFPYSIGLICVGLVLGGALYRSLDCNDKHNFACVHKKAVGTDGQYQESLLMWMETPGELILFVFLPPLIYEMSAYTNVYKFSKHFMSGLILAGPGVGVQCVLIACTTKYIFPYNWDWVECFLFGGILSATDPIAVISLLKELGCLPDLQVLIEAESVLNDGSSIVIFQLCYVVLTQPGGSAHDYVVQAFQLGLGGPPVGFLFCIATMLLLAFLHNPLLETTVTIAAAYLCFFTAQGSLQVSGVLAVMTLGVLLTMFGQSVISHEARHFLHVFWRMVEFMANTVIFVLAGAIIVFDAFLLKSDIIGASDWGYLFANYCLLFLIRLIMIAVCSPYMRRYGYRLTSRDCSLADFAKYMFVAAWGGLRGVVAMALALIIYGDRSVARHSADPRYADRLLFHVCGVVALTLLINGVTCEYIISWLGLGATRDPEQRYLDDLMMRETKVMIKSHLHNEFLVLKEARERSSLQQVDWDAVRGLVGIGDIASEYEDGAMCDGCGRDIPCTVNHGEEQPDIQEHSSIRFYQMCLENVKSSYEEQFSDHLISGQTFRALEFAVNCADDYIQTQQSQIKPRRSKPPNNAVDNTDILVGGWAINRRSMEGVRPPAAAATREGGELDDEEEDYYNRFDVGWLPTFLSCEYRPFYLQVGQGLLPTFAYNKLAAKYHRHQFETMLAVSDAYQELNLMLENASFGGHPLQQQVSEILITAELRLAELQCTVPALCAVVDTQRTAISLLKASRLEIERLHDAFQMRDSEFEALAARYKALARKARFGRIQAQPASPRDIARRHPLFRTLRVDQFNRIWDGLRQRPCLLARGDTILQQGRPNPGIFILLSGFAKAFVGEPSTDRHCVRVAVPGCLEGAVEWLFCTDAASGGHCLNRETLVAGSPVEALHLDRRALADLAVAHRSCVQEMWRAYGSIFATEVRPDLFHSIGISTGPPGGGFGQGTLSPTQTGGSLAGGSGYPAESVGALMRSALLLDYAQGTSVVTGHPMLLIRGRARLEVTALTTGPISGRRREILQVTGQNNERSRGGQYSPARVGEVDVSDPSANDKSPDRGTTRAKFADDEIRHLEGRARREQNEIRNLHTGEAEEEGEDSPEMSPFAMLRPGIRYRFLAQTNRVLLLAPPAPTPRPSDNGGAAAALAAALSGMYSPASIHAGANAPRALGGILDTARSSARCDHRIDTTDRGV